jgi:hypothetical protein
VVVAKQASVPAQVAASQPTAPPTQGKPAIPVTAAPKELSLADIISLTVDKDGLHAQWIASTSPEKFGRFDTTTPALHWVVSVDPQADPGNFCVEGRNATPQSPAEPTLFAVLVSRDRFWMREYYSKVQKSPAFVEYIQTPNSVRFIRRAWLNEQERDPAQQTDIQAATFAELQVAMGGKLEEYLAPMLALAGVRDPRRQVAGGGGTATLLASTIDQTKPGMYAEGKWSYQFVPDETQKGNHQGFLKYDNQPLVKPQPNDHIATPWGWMQWQEREGTAGNWLPVAQKPKTGHQLPDPATHPEVISRPPSAPVP